MVKKRFIDALCRAGTQDPANGTFRESKGTLWAPPEASIEGERESRANNRSRQHQANCKVTQATPKRLVEHRSLPWIP